MKMDMKDKNENKFELLAPAGSFEIFKAVIAAGADAVYVGGEAFGARAYANNFTDEELLTAIDYAHLCNKKVYLTVNTLLKNSEMDRLYDYLLPFYERGLDAVLVQDLGVLSYIRKHFPDLPVHTSTQMTVTGIEGARLLQSLGAERIVMAREVSLEEMRAIHEETGIELEAFVHGALCYSYSGQCLFSSMLGGRSGNRGRCAQPCRLAYSVLDEKRREYLSDSYVLSLKDMCGIEDLNKLLEAGVYSLKIEGRMKQLSYAAGVVSFYRRYIDELLQKGTGTVSREDKKQILELGNRCGFTNQYYFKKNGPDMVTFRKPNYEKTNEALHEEMIARYADAKEKLPADGVLTLHRGQPAEYRVCAGETQFRVFGMEVMQAEKKPIDPCDVKKRMEKTGDTPFVMRDVRVEADENIFLPNGALNQLRREALEGLKEKLLTAYYRKAAEYREDTETVYEPEESKEPELICLTEKRELLPVILEHSRVTKVYLDFGAYSLEHFAEELREDIEQVRSKNKKAYLAMPRIFRRHTADFFVRQVEELGKVVSGFLVRNYEELAYVREYFPKQELVTDHNLYAYNDSASQAYASLGAFRNTVPLELNRGEISHRDNRCSEMVVYGYYPLMTSAQCVHANTEICDKTPGLCYLKDRYKVEFPVKNYCNACYNVIYNSLPVMLFEEREKLQKAGIRAFRLDFTIENPKETKRILEAWEKGEIPKEREKFTRGHYKRGVE